MMVRRENGHAVWFSSTLFSNIQSYPQSVDNSVEIVDNFEKSA